MEGNVRPQVRKLLALTAAGVISVAALALAVRQRKRRLQRLSSCKNKPACEHSENTSAQQLLREKLTVILSTSAIGRHPSTDLLDEVLASFQLAEGIQNCDLIIVCDGYRSTNEAGEQFKESKFRSGIVDPTSATNYETYKETLRARATVNRIPAVHVLELDSRHGFGFAVRAALELVRTPYVIVVQHDRPFTRPCNIPRLVRAMEAAPDRFKYVGLPTSTTCGHKYHVLSKYGLRIESVLADADGLELVPLVQWYDSTHVCLTAHYRNFVFGPRKLVARGGFIEDKLGQAELQAIRSLGLEKAHPEFGTYVASGDGFRDPCVGHLDGRDGLNIKNFQFVTNSSNEASVSWAAQAAQAAKEAMPAKPERGLDGKAATVPPSPSATGVPSASATASRAGRSGASSGSGHGQQSPSQASSRQACGGQELEYLVDNSQLGARTPGLGYRTSMILSERCPEGSCEPWGAIVRGVDEGNGWLRVGHWYLPMMLNGVRTLRPKSSHGNASNGNVVVLLPKAQNPLPPPTSPPRLNFGDQSSVSQTAAKSCTRHKATSRTSSGQVLQGSPNSAKSLSASSPSSAVPEPRKISLSGLASAPKDICPEHGWEYLDPAGKVQGPFSLAEMYQWNTKGYFRADLPIRCEPNQRFVALALLFPAPLVPFQSPPRRHLQGRSPAQHPR
eukprot:TRINITY_DN62391_c0_g1_i1.p1 TRINITY_DN62391_c0_g1~~TRINITY_DN62391_c0_g1_i1.p1  ORF type:complete len:675 (-),score=71.09 TRINITY_DN62391_c0_g1_i1:56-2080(-)